MSITLKIIVFSVVFVTLNAFFSTNLLTHFNVPLAQIGDYIETLALFISNIAKFGDIFLPSGQLLLMIQALVLFIWAFVQYKIFYGIIKLLLY